MLAGAAQASGAVFRESPALQGESAGKRSKAPLTNKAASADKTVQNGKREILHPRFESASAAKANAGHREDRSGRADRPCKQRQDGRQKLTVVKIVSCGLVVPICPRAVRHELKMGVKTRVLSVEDDRSVQLVRNSPWPNAYPNSPFELHAGAAGF